ncbi:hypothetical protein NMG60_11030730 [Bertholletia excelsa]
MLRRSLLELSSRQSFRRSPTWIATQVPSYLSSRKQHSAASKPNAPQGSGSTGKPPESGNSLPKIIIGTLALGAAFLTAYQFNQRLEEQRAGTEDPFKSLKGIKDLQEDERLGEQNVMSSVQESKLSNSIVEPPEEKPAEQNTETHSKVPHLDHLNRNKEEIKSQVENKAKLMPEEIVTPFQERELKSSQNIPTSKDGSKARTSLEEGLDMRSTEAKSSIHQHEAVDSTTVLSQANTISEESEMKSSSRQQETPSTPIDAHGSGFKKPSSLLDEYYLRDNIQAPVSSLSDKQKDLVGAIQDSGDVYISKDGKLVLDFLQAIHAAEKRQAELDACTFFEEKRKMKEKYEKELKDARVRELMYAEEAALLDKELNKERSKAAAALKSLQEELEEKHRTELEQKVQSWFVAGKAQLAAAIANEKSSQIEKMAEANLHINALCMAFYARSEEARQRYSAHKLALGALALEDALSKGVPIQKEIDALHNYLEGIDKDPLLDLVLSSLPEETRSCGSDTILELKQKFDALKGTLRHFSLIPPGGGGILAHSLAHVASWLKVREADQSGDGIESLINRVENFLAEGKLVEAADTLEQGVKGTQAAEVSSNWLQRARNRAITEQALTLLQSYATSISLA